MIVDAKVKHWKENLMNKNMILIKKYGGTMDGLTYI